MRPALKPALFCASLLPAVAMVATVPQRVEPVEYLIFHSGLWSMAFLCIGLAVTPLRKLLQWPLLASVRGMFGLFAFFYACIHVAAVAVVDQGFDAAEIWHIATLRPTNTLDAIAFLMMVPLAATSSKRSKKWLGARRWTQLHRLAYLIAPLAAARFWVSALQGRGTLAALVITATLLWLLGIRVYWSLTDHERHPNPSSPAP